MKKILGIALSLSLTLTGCSKNDPSNNESASQDNTHQVHTITIASTGSDAEVWNHIVQLPETTEAGLELKVKNFTDYVAMNTAVANKEIDINAFQSYAYMMAYNEANQHKIVPLSTTYLEPMGIYSSKFTKLNELKTGATVAIPNDGANESRALLLLQSAGLIKLKNTFDNVKGTTSDLVENPRQIIIKPIQMATAVRIKDEVDAIVLGNTLAMEGGLNVLKDAIYYEPIDQSTKMNVNILATAADRQNDPVLQKVGALYHTQAVKDFVQEKFSGTKVDVNKPISYLTESK